MIMQIINLLLWVYWTTRWKNNSFYFCVKTVQLEVRISRIFVSGLVIGGDYGFSPALVFSGKYHLQCVILTIWFVACYLPLLFSLTCSCLLNVLSLPVLLSNFVSVASCRCCKPHRSKSDQRIIYSSQSLWVFSLHLN